MPQHDYVIDNSTGLNVRTDINAVLQAIVSQNSGPIEPSATFANMLWLDTGVDPVVLRQRNPANTGWIAPTGSVPGGDAPSDGKAYGRQDGAWAETVKLAGDRMTGALVVNGAAPPAALNPESVNAATLSARLHLSFNATRSADGTQWNRWAAGYGLVQALDSVSGSTVWYSIATGAAGGAGAASQIMTLGATGSLTITGAMTAQNLLLPNGGNVASNAGTYVLTADSANNIQFDRGSGWWRVINGNAETVRFQPGGNMVVATNGFKPGGGVWADSSDARIKDVAGDYASGLDAIRALRPVRYRFKGNDFDSDPNAPLPEVDPDDPFPAPMPPVSRHTDTEREFIGLIAQEAETAMPEMVTQAGGWIDGEQVSDIRMLDATPLVFALINAVKELAAKVEALESAQ